MMNESEKAVCYDHLNNDAKAAGFPDASILEYVCKLQKNPRTQTDHDDLILVRSYRDDWAKLSGTNGYAVSTAFEEIENLRAKVKDLEARPPQAAGSQWWDDLWAFLVNAGMQPGEKTQENEDVENFVQELLDIRDATEALEEEFDDEDFDGDDDDGILPATFSGCTFNILYA